jgi:hypothetical protein
MMHHSIRRATHHLSCLSPLLLTLSLFFAADTALAAAAGDQVELKATHQAGVPFYTLLAPRKTSSTSWTARAHT